MGDKCVGGGGDTRVEEGMSVGQRRMGRRGRGGD